MTRILQVGLGPLGQRIASDLLDRGVGHLVAAVDIDPSLAGVPVSQLVPAADPKLRVLSSLDAVTNWDQIDAAIVATSSDLKACEATLRELLRRGVCVVSTCEELIYPWLRHVAIAEELDELAKRNGGRLLGTGVNPGFLMDALPAFLTSVCRSVRGVAAYRVQDASVRRIPFQKKIGAGLDDAQFAARLKDGSLRHVGLGESLHFIAHYVGLPLERWDEDIAPIKADRDLSSGVGPIARGRVAGVRQVARGYFDERVVVHLEFQAAIGQRDPYDRIVVHGEPDIDCVIPGGVHGDVATCAIIVNAVPRLRKAAPGLHTMATVAPPIHVGSPTPAPVRPR
jgi:4-hydroxy-tetrahydrodipicolinate reductase